MSIRDASVDANATTWQSKDICEEATRRPGMLTLDLMRNIDLKPTPWGQIITAVGVLMVDYNIPGKATRIRVEGLENIPKTGKVFLAMNHTDRFNYWPLQYRMWLDERVYTATWVKGKYFNNPLMAQFMVHTNNIPTPSRGYIITCDTLGTLGEPPSDALYRVVRDALDSDTRDMDAIKERAAQLGIMSQLDELLTRPRVILGRSFNPHRETYFDAMDDLFSKLMDEFIRLNNKAFSMGHKIIVFPEGTRSLRLTKGRPGLAQMALRTGATIVPIGCNGSDDLYPGDSPFSKGGEVVYRIGEPLRPDGDLREFQIAEDYVPFTKQAQARFGDHFQGVTDLLMERIAALLDSRYLDAGETTEVRGANRFV